MNLSPSCSHYLRRILRQYLTLPSNYVPDLLGQYERSQQTLEQRLNLIYLDAASYNKVVLNLELLIHSHQQSHSSQKSRAKQETLHQILWWLGYDIHLQEKQRLEIFIVEDSIEVLHLVSTILNERGYRVDSALSGHLALNKIRAAPPALILLDICLPDINGYRIYEQLQSASETSHIPIIFLTGVEEPIEVKLRAYERLSYLAKPFKPEKMLELVEQHLQNSSQPYQTSSLEVELRSRQEKAKQLSLLCTPQASSGKTSKGLDVGRYFFRATLDGRYLRVSSALAELCGYNSSEAMIAQVKNLWEEIYGSSNHRERWNTCRQYPNQDRISPIRIRNSYNGFSEAVENICLVQDNYQQPLFFQGFLTPQPLLAS